MSALNNAAQYMGIEELKPKQVEAIATFVSGKDTLVSLPTEYGSLLSLQYCLYCLILCLVSHLHQNAI